MPGKKRGRGKSGGKGFTKKPKKSPKKAATQPIANDDGGVWYEAETVLDVRKTAKGVWQYKVRWKGFGPSDDSWEPEGNLSSALFENALQLRRKLEDKQEEDELNKLEDIFMEEDTIEVVEKKGTEESEDTAMDASNAGDTEKEDYWEWNDREQVQFREIERIDVNDPDAVRRVTEARENGVPVCVVGHQGWAQFALPWLQLKGVATTTINEAKTPEATDDKATPALVDKEPAVESTDGKTDSMEATDEKATPLVEATDDKTAPVEAADGETPPAATTDAKDATVDAATPVECNDDDKATSTESTDDKVAPPAIDDKATLADAADSGVMQTEAVKDTTTLPEAVDDTTTPTDSTNSKETLAGPADEKPSAVENADGKATAVVATWEASGGLPTGQEEDDEDETFLTVGTMPAEYFPSEEEPKKNPAQDFPTSTEAASSLTEVTEPVVEGACKTAEVTEPTVEETSKMAEVIAPPPQSAASPTPSDQASKLTTETVTPAEAAASVASSNPPVQASEVSDDNAPYHAGASAANNSNPTNPTAVADSLSTEAPKRVSLQPGDVNENPATGENPVPDENPASAKKPASVAEAPAAADQEGATEAPADPPSDPQDMDVEVEADAPDEAGKAVGLQSEVGKTIEVNRPTEPAEWLDLTKEWEVNVDRMIADLGDEKVPVVRPRYNEQKPIDRKIKLSEFLKRSWPSAASAGRKLLGLYLHQWQFPLSETAAVKLCGPGRHKPLPNDIFGEDLLELWQEEGIDNPYQYIFMGREDTVSKLHRDPGGLAISIAPVVGKKEVVLVHRSDGLACLSHLQANLEKIDLHKFPLVSHARIYKSTIQPGEILIMPQGTFHQCRNVTPCLSYSRFYLDTVNLKAFVESCTNGDAPEISHEEILWNCSHGLIKQLDEYVEKIQAEQKKSNWELKEKPSPQIMRKVRTLRQLRNICRWICIRFENGDRLSHPEATGESQGNVTTCEEEAKRWTGLLRDIDLALHELRYRNKASKPAFRSRATRREVPKSNQATAQARASPVLKSKLELGLDALPLVVKSVESLSPNTEVAVGNKVVARLQGRRTEGVIRRIEDAMHAAYLHFDGLGDEYDEFLPFGVLRLPVSGEACAEILPENVKPGKVVVYRTGTEEYRAVVKSCTRETFVWLQLEIGEESYNRWLPKTALLEVKGE